MEYALINSDVVQDAIVADPAFIQTIQADWQAIVDITNVSPQPGIGWGYVNGQFIAPPAPPPLPPEITWDISRVALQNRFPITANGVSTKYDLMTLFLTDTAYANSLGVSGQDLIDQRALIITGNNRLGTAEYVNLKSQQTISYITLCTNAAFPAVFRLTQAEADGILNTPARNDEKP